MLRIRQLVQCVQSYIAWRRVVQVITQIIVLQINDVYAFILGGHLGLLRHDLLVLKYQADVPQFPRDLDDVHFFFHSLVANSDQFVKTIIADWATEEPLPEKEEVAGGADLWDLVLFNFSLLIRCQILDHYLVSVLPASVLFTFRFKEYIVRAATCQV